jgi:hypothetical protein
MGRDDAATVPIVGLSARPAVLHGIRHAPVSRETPTRQQIQAVAAAAARLTATMARVICQAPR